MILAASRKKAVVFSLSSEADAIYEAIQELFDELGGVTIELLIDNPKALVIENNPHSIDEIEYDTYFKIDKYNRICHINKTELLRQGYDVAMY